MLTQTLKPKKCKVCKATFTPISSFAQACGLDCALALVDKEKAKAARAKRLQEHRADKVKRDKLKRLADLISEAQTAFNAFIRERDKQAGHRCISSGRALDWTGNGVDAGHYRSRGAAPQLRFNEANCHAQSKQDNRYGSGNVVDYRLGLIARIGLPAVEALEADSTVHKWTREELVAIKAMYQRRLKELRAAAERKETA